MMKAYIQTNKEGNFYNINAFTAHEGFQNLGWETQKFYALDEIRDDEPESVVVGGIATVRGRLVQLGIAAPKHEIDYPEALHPYLGRKLWSSTLEELMKQEEWNVFIKPKKETKKFVGKVITGYKDFIGITAEPSTEIWCSEPVNFKTEWRCFIYYGTLLDIRYYKGAWDSKLDLSIIQSAVQDFKNAPVAYALDFGIDGHNRMKLVEVNDGHSLGTYGISPLNYAKFLAARWAQLTQTKDYAYF